MTFQTIEANLLFSLAVLIEKTSLANKRKFDRGDIDISIYRKIEEDLMNIADDVKNKIEDIREKIYNKKSHKGDIYA